MSFLLHISGLDLWQEQASSKPKDEKAWQLPLWCLGALPAVQCKNASYSVGENLWTGPMGKEGSPGEAPEIKYRGKNPAIPASQLSPDPIQTASCKKQDQQKIRPAAPAQITELLATIMVS